MKKRLISLFVTISMIAVVTAVFTTFVSADNYYHTINSAEDLQAFRDEVNRGYSYAGQTILLACDIDLQGSENNQWIPIGNGTGYDQYKFEGTFDGVGHTISGLYINTTEDNQGLFGYLGGEVKNLTVSGVVSGGSAVGGIVGMTNWKVTNCRNNCTVSSTNNSADGHYGVGGVVGFSFSVSGHIENCVNTGNVIGGDVGGVGGVVGVSYGKIENCYNTGAISGTNEVGGVAGVSMVQGYVNVYVKNSYNTGTVTGTSMVGGVTGSNHLGLVANCYNTGKVTGSEYVGGIAGVNYAKIFNDDSAAKLENCYYLNGTASKGVNAHTSDADVSGTAVLAEEKFDNQNSFVGWDFDTMWKINNEAGRPLLRANTEFIEPADKPAPRNELYEVANGNTTFNIPVYAEYYPGINTPATVKMEVFVQVISKHGGKWEAINVSSEVTSGEKTSVQVKIPYELLIGDKIRIITRPVYIWE